MLMPALQMLAARIAGIDRLVFHLGDEQGAFDFTAARELADEVPPMAADQLPGYLAGLGFSWGESDGN